MAGKNDGWTQVRVRDDVLEKLALLKNQLESQQRENATGATPWQDGRISMSDVIKTLLWRNDQHAARSKASSQRRRKGGDPVI